VRPVLDAQRVVEVARGLAVDRAEAPVAQVDAIGRSPGPTDCASRLGLGQRGGRELSGTAATEDLRDLGARVVGSPSTLSTRAASSWLPGSGWQVISTTTAWPSWAVEPPSSAT
jgi:hypothetical protein